MSGRHLFSYIGEKQGGKFMAEFDYLEKLLQELKVRKDQLFSKNFFCSPEKFKKEFYSKIEHKKQQEMDQHGS